VAERLLAKITHRSRTVGFSEYRERSRQSSQALDLPYFRHSTNRSLKPPVEELATHQPEVQARPKTAGSRYISLLACDSGWYFNRSLNIGAEKVDHYLQAGLAITSRPLLTDGRVLRTTGALLLGHALVVDRGPYHRTGEMSFWTPDPNDLRACIGSADLATH